MSRSLRLFLIAAALAGSQASLAQTAPSPGTAVVPREELRKLCAALPAQPQNGRELAQRAECVLTGALESKNRVTEARELARAALLKGEPGGGLMLYLAFLNNPAYQYAREGRVDEAAYRKLAALPVSERGDQVEALEGLAYAAGKNHPAAGLLLARYLHDTSAPGNVARLLGLILLLKRDESLRPQLERFEREAEAIHKVGRTNSSALAFLQAYRLASEAAAKGYQVQKGNAACGQQPVLKSTSPGEIESPVYLPLNGTLVEKSYLVQGRWSEFWAFSVCDEEVPVKVDFEADGWGGAAARASHNKGG